MWKYAYACLLVLGLSCSAVAEELVLETWRVDDEVLWKEQFLPRFQALHPEIRVRLQPLRSAEYDQGLSQRLADGKAPPASPVDAPQAPRLALVPLAAVRRYRNLWGLRHA